MIKLSLNALEARKLAKSFGLIYEGTGRKFALRSLRKGKTFEQLGAISEKHFKKLKPIIKKLSPKGKEVGLEVYKTRSGPVMLGGAGVSKMPISQKVVKTFHSHPYSGYSKLTPKTIADEMVNHLIPKGQRRNNPMYKVMKEQFKETYTQNAAQRHGLVKSYSPIEKAHPSPKGTMTSDASFMTAMPSAHHNILSPEDNILGIHKIRPGWLRSIYKTV